MSTTPTMYLIQIVHRYFSARGGYNGRLTGRTAATLFTLSDATDRAARMGGVVVGALSADRVIDARGVRMKPKQVAYALRCIT